jgi:F0F1-type ATP synthase assembly protein I
MTPDDTRNLHRAEDDAWSRAMELALTPVVAGGLGYAVDRVLGTLPVFAIVFLVLAVVATFIKMYYAYDAKMKTHDAESPWGRARAHADRVRADRDEGATAPATAPALATSDRVPADAGGSQS